MGSRETPSQKPATAQSREQLVHYRKNAVLPPHDFPQGLVFLPAQMRGCEVAETVHVEIGDRNSEQGERLHLCRYAVRKRQH